MRTRKGFKRFKSLLDVAVMLSRLVQLASMLIRHNL